MQEVPYTGIIRVIPFLHIELTQLVAFIGYPGITLAIYLETGLFFGFFLPGASMLFIAGILASQEYFNIWLLAPLVTIAAILGDMTGYWFGRYVGTTIFHWADSRFFHKDHVERTQEFFKKYGRITILLARFIPVVRTFAPILAGVGKMDFRVFFFYNVLGAVLWGGGVVVAGYFLGTKVPGIEKYITLIVLGIIIASSIPLLVEWLRQRAQKKV